MGIEQTGGLVSHSFDDVPDYIQNYYPEFSYILPNGNLLMSWSGEEGNEHLDGRIEIAPDHPNYAVWRHGVENREQILQARDAQRKQEREARRQASRARRGLNTMN